MKNDMKNDVLSKLDEIGGIIQERCKLELKGNVELLNDSLYTGGWGMVLFLHYYEKISKRKESKIILNEYLDFRLERLCSTYPQTFTFCDGLAGVMYLLRSLKLKGELNIDIDDIEREFDKYFQVALNFSKKECGYDFLHGTLGIGFYYLKRFDKVAQDKVLQVVNFLTESARTDEDGLYWTFHMKDGSVVPNISLSHGISSIIIFLARVIEKNVCMDDAKLLLKLALKFLQSQEIDKNIYDCSFPALSKQVPGWHSRLAWCYGDLGVVLALYKASCVLNDNNLLNKSLEVLRFSTQRRTPKRSDVIDAEICHGTAGIAQIFKRMYLNTHEKLFLETSHYWIEQTILMGNKPKGLCGYEYYDMSGWQTSYDFLLGISGIGLALLASLEDDNEKLSSWDEVLLLS